MTQNPTLRLIYKALAVLLLTYALVAGMTLDLPAMKGLGQTSRNLFYHVPMWFTMYLMMLVSVIWSMMHLANGKMALDEMASQAARVGVTFGLMGLVTGIVWSRVTWSQLITDDMNPRAWWVWDPKQTFALAAVLIYLAYLLLRSSIDEPVKRARIAAVYNIFAAASLVPLTLVIPRVIGGLHPGGAGEGPVFNSGDIGTAYRVVFYPAILGFMFLALWVLELRIRTRRLQLAADSASPADAGLSRVTVTPAS